MALRDDWYDPNELDAFRGLMACQDDNSYYAAVKGFAMYVSEVQQRFEDKCTQLFGFVPLRVQNLTPETADMYNNTGCTGATKGPQCVLDQQDAGKLVLPPNLTQVQIKQINDCVPLEQVAMRHTLRQK